MNHTNPPFLPASLRTSRNPVVEDMLAVLRNKNTKNSLFRDTMDQLAPLLLDEALELLPQRVTAVDTPLRSSVTVKKVDPRSFTSVQILGAGLAFDTAVSRLARRPETYVYRGLLAMSRDHNTHQPTLHYDRLPPRITSDVTIVFEPMCATGGSLSDAVHVVKERGAENIICISVIGADEGVMRMQRDHPGVHLYMAAVDKELDENKYIVPGLGDFGDRYLGINPN